MPIVNFYEVAANFELKRHDKVIPLADQAIATQSTPMP